MLGSPDDRRILFINNGLDSLVVWSHCNDRASSSHPDVDLLLSLEPEELAVKLLFLVRKTHEAMLPA
jgi:hypothetical protein